jgi:methyl-accepting chemotaxis protein
VVIMIKEKRFWNGIKKLRKMNVRSVRSRLIVSFMLILLVPSICIGYFSFQSAEQQLRAKMSSAAKSSVELVNKTIDQYIGPVMADADVLAGQLNAAAVDNKDPGVRKLVDGFIAKHPELELVTIGNEKGNWMKAPDPGKQDYDPRKRDWYIGAMNNQGKVFVSKPYISVTSKNMVVTVAQVFPDGKGVLGLNLDLSKLNGMLRDVKIGVQGYVYLLDSDSKYIAHPTNAPGFEAKGPQYEYMHKNDHDFIQYILNGVNKEAYFATNTLTGWKVVGSMIVAEYAQAAKPILIRTLIVVLAAIIISSLIIWFILRSILNPMRELQRGTERIKVGDLTGRIRIKHRDEFGALANDFNAMAESLYSLVSEMSETSGQLAASSQEMTAITDQTADSLQHVNSSIMLVAEATVTQSRSTEETSRAVEEMSSGIQKIAMAAGEIVYSAARTDQDVQAGSGTVQEVIKQMASILQSVGESSAIISNLSELSSQIRDMNAAISDIAGKTNLLSLNAAIEAARAGEQGRGFAVVASEIRKLADQSKRTADEIHSVISQMTGMIDTAAQVMNVKVVTEVDKGMAISEKAGAAFIQIEHSTGHIVEQIHDISSIAEQMSASSEQVAASMEEMTSTAMLSASNVQSVSASSEEQLASIQEINSSSAHLSAMAEQLQRMVERFKL